jgi:hypothetical protein
MPGGPVSLVSPLVLKSKCASCTLLQTPSNIRARKRLFIMGKFRPAKPKRKAKPSTAVGAIPCLILLVTGIVLLSLLFYSILKSG